MAIVQLWPISGGEPWQGSDGGLYALEAGRHYSMPPAVGHPATKHNLIASLPTAVIAPWDQLRPCSVTDGRAVIMRQSPCRCYASRCDGAAQEGDGPTPSWPSAISTSAHCALASHHRHGHQSAGQPAPSVTSELSGKGAFRPINAGRSSDPWIRLRPTFGQRSPGVSEVQVSHPDQRRYQGRRDGKCQPSPKAHGTEGNENGKCEFPHRVHGVSSWPVWLGNTMDETGFTSDYVAGREPAHTCRELAHTYGSRH